MPESGPASPAELFEKNRYILVKNFLPEQLQRVMHRYALMKVQTGQVTREDQQMPGTPSLYGDTLMETLMELAMPQVEQLTGKRLFPTYAYFRVYRNGDELRPHIDGLPVKSVLPSAWAMTRAMFPTRIIVGLSL